MDVKKFKISNIVLNECLESDVKKFSNVSQNALTSKDGYSEMIYKFYINITKFTRYVYWLNADGFKVVFF